MVGIFVLGVLMGWLAEWLYFTFWVKPNDTDGDCSALKAELELKNKQISSLQSQLGSATKSAVGSNSKASATATKPKAVKSSTKTVAKTTSKAASKKSQGSKQKATTKKATTNKATSNKKTSASKRTTVKNTSAKKAPATKSSASKTKGGGDDLTKISGIGPSMAVTLNSLGINSYQKLAATDDDILRDMLEASGARMNNNKEAMDSWNEQATVAAKGDFVALKKMQAELKK